MPQSAPEEPPRGPATVAAVVAFYFVVSISLVYINKVLFSTPGMSVGAPIFITWFQCVVSAIICWGLGVIGQTATRESFFFQFPELKLSREVIQRVLRLTVIFVGMVTFNNLCLKYVEVSFYNIARSLTIVFNVIFTFFILGEGTSARVIGCICVVILGFFVGANSEMNFSMIGTVFGITSSTFVSLNSIYTKDTLKLVKPYVESGRDKMWLLTGVNNAIASVLFLPIILVTEAEELAQSSAVLTNPAFWAAMSVSGVLGFLIGIAVVLQINVTSPLTHNISGTAKAAVQTAGAFVIWGNQTNATNIFGVFLVLAGSLAYAYVRFMEKAAASRHDRRVEPDGAVAGKEGAAPPAIQGKPGEA